MIPYKPTAYDEGVLRSFRALFEGKATEGQQQRAMQWLLKNACHIGEVSFSPDALTTAFMEGQRSIGIQLARLREPEALKLIEGKSRTRGKPEANTDDDRG